MSCAFLPSASIAPSKLLQRDCGVAWLALHHVQPGVAQSVALFNPSEHPVVHPSSPPPHLMNSPVCPLPLQASPAPAPSSPLGHTSCPHVHGPVQLSLLGSHWVLFPPPPHWAPVLLWVRVWAEVVSLRVSVVRPYALSLNGSFPEWGAIKTHLYGIAQQFV